MADQRRPIIRVAPPELRRLVRLNYIPELTSELPTWPLEASYRPTDLLPGDNPVRRWLLDRNAPRQTLDAVRRYLDTLRVPRKLGDRYWYDWVVAIEAVHRFAWASPPGRVVYPPAVAVVLERSFGIKERDHEKKRQFDQTFPRRVHQADPAVAYQLQQVQRARQQLVPPTVPGPSGHSHTGPFPRQPTSATTGPDFRALTTQHSSTASGSTETVSPSKDQRRQLESDRRRQHVESHPVSRSVRSAEAQGTPTIGSHRDFTPPNADLFPAGPARATPVPPLFNVPEYRHAPPKESFTEGANPNWLQQQHQKWVTQLIKG